MSNNLTEAEERIIGMLQGGMKIQIIEIKATDLIKKGFVENGNVEGASAKLTVKGRNYKKL